MPSSESDNTEIDTPHNTDLDSEFAQLAEEAVDASGVAAGSETDSKATLQQKLTAAEQEVLRSRAELENFRKRILRDTDQQVRFASVPLVRDLLDVVDNLNRALSTAPADESAKALREGVQMVTLQLTSILAKHGCNPIKATGNDFDPNFHEAIAQMPSPEVAAGKVSQEVAVGYTLHERVVRPSQVIVSTGQPS